MNEDVKKYIGKQESLQSKILKKIRKLIHGLAPMAIESMSYGVPAFKLKNGLVCYASYKKHIGLYPEPETIKFFRKELECYETSKGTIKFKLDEQIPYDLIEKVVKFKNQDK